MDKYDAARNQYGKYGRHGDEIEREDSSDRLMHDPDYLQETMYFHEKPAFIPGGGKFDTDVTRPPNMKRSDSSRYHTNRAELDLQMKRSESDRQMKYAESGRHMKYAEQDRQRNYSEQDRQRNYSESDRQRNYSEQDRQRKYSDPDRSMKRAEQDRQRNYSEQDRQRNYSEQDRQRKYSDPDRSMKRPEQDRQRNYSDPDRAMKRTESDRAMKPLTERHVKQLYPERTMKPPSERQLKRTDSRLQRKQSDVQHQNNRQERRPNHKGTMQRQGIASNATEKCQPEATEKCHPEIQFPRLVMFVRKTGEDRRFYALMYGGLLAVAFISLMLIIAAHEATVVPNLDDKNPFFGSTSFIIAATSMSVLFSLVNLVPSYVARWNPFGFWWSRFILHLFMLILHSAGMSVMLFFSNIALGCSESRCHLIRATAAFEFFTFMGHIVTLFIFLSCIRIVHK